MKVWFLRIKHPAITREAVRQARLAPILFRKVPLKNCRVGMEEEEIDAVVSRVYSDQSPAARYQHAGTLRRYLLEAAPGDLVGMKVNREAEILYGRFDQGEVRPFPGLEKDGLKGRPFVPIGAKEGKEIAELALPESVLKYRATFCNWLDDEGVEGVDVPDEEEKRRRELYARRMADDLQQIKFIRVGADLGCGERLSRIFPGHYYHFIPIPKHSDPEFCRFTYGDVAKRGDGRVASKGRSLSNLRKGDVLVFYAGFEPEGGASCGRVVGIFAYLVVKEAWLFTRTESNRRALCFSDRPRSFDPFAEFVSLASAEAWHQLQARYGKWNAHFNDEYSKRMDVVICGNRRESRLLTKVEVLEAFDSDTKNYIVSEATTKKWGLTQGHDLKMSPVRTIAPDKVKVDEVYARLRNAD